MPVRADAPEQPVLFYLVGHFTDHVNITLTEDRLRYALDLAERISKETPHSHASVSVLFSGASSQALESRNAQTHLVDAVKDAAQRGLVEVGYDGAEEPTLEKRPSVDFANLEDAGARWKARKIVAEKLLSEQRDPLTGESRPGTGGLAAMQKVFGPAAYVEGLVLTVKGPLISGRLLPAPTRADAGPPGAPAYIPKVGLTPEVGGDSEAAWLLSRAGFAGLMPGIPNSNPTRLAGFRDRTRRFGEIIAPAPNTAPELFWQDGILRLSEAAGEVHSLHGSEGPEALKTMLAKAGRKTVHVIRIEIASADDYFQPAFLKSQDYPPLKYAYAHPTDPLLRTEVLAGKESIESAHLKEDNLLKWASQQLMSTSAKSGLVSNKDLESMVQPPYAQVATSDLRDAAREAVAAWGSNTFPRPFLRVKDRYLSLADQFQLLTDGFAELHRTGNYPPSVTTRAILGPARLLTGHGPNAGELRVSSLAKKCAEIAGGWRSQEDSGLPNNIIPSWLEVDGINVNPAQFVRILETALVNLPTEKVPVRMTYMLPEPGGIYPTNRPLSDIGFVWTIKPAPLNLPELLTSK